VGARSAAIALAALACLLASTVGEAEGKGKGARKSAAIAPLTKQGLPNVQAAAAIVLDAENGVEFFARNPDEVRAIASTGKIFVALLVRKKGIDLEASTEITKVDRDFARGGARTRLPVGHSFRNVDLLRAMLVASDNRAPTALGRAVGLDADQLVAELNVLAREMGLEKTKFSCPSGLRGNESTAREMTVGLRAAMKDSLLADIMSTRDASIRSVASKPRLIHYRNTNRSLHANRFEVTGGKTGYTDAAGYCLIIAARVDGRQLVMAFLGTHGKLTRFGDFSRVDKWLRNGGLAAARTASVGTSHRETGKIDPP